MFTFINSALLFLAATASAAPVNGNNVADRHLVLFKPGTKMAQILDHLDTFHTAPEKWFSFEENGELVMGYSSVFPPSTFSALVHDNSIDYIEPDIEISLYDYGMNRNHIEKQDDAPWGLTRVSHRNLTEKHTYYYDGKDGNGVNVYVIDTGVFIEHNEFEGRARWGASFIGDNNQNFYEMEDIYKRETDGNGHGTHCAGTIAGKTYGVCKHCNIVAVQVLDGAGSGSLSGVIAGIEWAVKDFLGSGRPGVGSMSLGGGMSRTLNRAVESAVDQGMHMVVAAGNDNRDSCMYSPASSPKAITVGATSRDDKMAWFSNWGECVDIFAPGHEILSSWIGNKDATNTISGTSMATPHSAGVVASVLSRKSMLAAMGTTPKQMKKALQKLATRDLLKGLPEDTKTVNLLLFNGINGDEQDGDEDDEELIFMTGQY